MITVSKLSEDRRVGFLSTREKTRVNPPKDRRRSKLSRHLQHLAGTKRDMIGAGDEVVGPVDGARRSHRR